METHQISLHQIEFEILIIKTMQQDICPVMLTRCALLELMLNTGIIVSNITVRLYLHITPHVSQKVLSDTVFSRFMILFS